MHKKLQTNILIFNTKFALINRYKTQSERIESIHYVLFIHQLLFKRPKN